MRASLLLLSVLTSACGVEPGTSDLPLDPDPEPPVDLVTGEGQLLFPPMSRVETSLEVLHVRGQANATAVRINGELAATVDGFANWSFALALAPGENRIEVTTEIDDESMLVAEATAVRREAGELEDLYFDGDYVFSQLGWIDQVAVRFHAPSDSLDFFDLETWPAEDSLVTRAMPISVNGHTIQRFGDVMLYGGLSCCGLSVLDARTLERRAQIGGDQAIVPLVSGALPTHEAVVRIANDLVAVNLDDVSTRVLSSGTEPLYASGGLVDAARGRVLISVDEIEPACVLVEVSIATGERRCSTLPTHAGSIALRRDSLFSLSLESPEGEIYATRLDDGTSRLLSKPDQGIPLRGLMDLVYDAARDVLVGGRVWPIFIDPVSGDRVIPHR